MSYRIIFARFSIELNLVKHLKKIIPIFFLFFSQSHANTLICENPGSDPDGDGWGWENGQSCQVQAQQPQLQPQVNDSQSESCPDPDGDGWGWYNNASCRVNDVAAGVVSPAQATNECVDYDGDGWGWANGQSCRVTAAAHGTESSITEEEQEEVEVFDNSPVIESNPNSSALDVSQCDVVLTSGQSIDNALRAHNTVCLNGGRYSVGQSLSFNSGQSIRGLDGGNLPVIQTAAGRGLTTTRVNNVAIRNLVVDGNSTGATEFAILVGSGSSNITIENVVVRNTVGIGIGITGSSNVRVQDTTVRNIGLDVKLRQAIWVTTGSRSVVLDGVSIEGRSDDVAGGDHAITCIDGVRGFTVTNSRSQFAGSGAVAINNCSSINVSGNTLIDGREHGVDIVNGSVDAIVQNNVITGFDRSAMVFDDHSWQCAGCGSNPTGIRVVGNRMSNNNRVNLARCRGIAVDRNMLVNPNESQKANSDWVDIAASNTVDSDSELYCTHIH